MADHPVVVIKLGSNALVDAQGRLDLGFLDSISQQVSAIVEAGWQPVLVSSGAVACGVAELGLAGAPDSMPERQALASIGQAGLAHRWQVALSAHGLSGAQILLTDDDFNDRVRYLNLSAAFRALFAFGAIPVINENDTVSVAELTVGDNDRLSAMVASQLGAEVLLLLTDIDGCYDRDPREPGAQRIANIDVIDDALIARTGGAGSRGRGGMRSKLEAARLAAGAGVRTVIARARSDQVIARALDGADVGTQVAAGERQQPSSWRRWLALARRCQGSLRIDGGAVAALRDQGRSLLPAGIRAVEGPFERGDTVYICDETGTEVARGLASLSASELEQAMGLRMDEAAEALGYALPRAAVHRDNLLVVSEPYSRDGR
jgi:glutamate 5-kinase